MCIRDRHGADAPLQRKPSPLLLQQACKALGIAPVHLLMVGDAAGDIAAALAAGSAAAWAGWGYGREPTQAPAAMWRLSAPHELLLQLAMPCSASTTEH